MLNCFPDYVLKRYNHRNEKIYFIPATVFMAACSVTHQNTSHAKPVIIGYVGGYRGIADVESVDAVGYHISTMPLSI